MSRPSSRSGSLPGGGETLNDAIVDDDSDDENVWQDLGQNSNQSLNERTNQNSNDSNHQNPAPADNNSSAGAGATADNFQSFESNSFETFENTSNPNNDSINESIISAGSSWARIAGESDVNGRSVDGRSLDGRSLDAQSVDGQTNASWEEIGDNDSILTGGLPESSTAEEGLVLGGVDSGEPGSKRRKMTESASSSSINPPPSILHQFKNNVSTQFQNNISSQFRNNIAGQFRNTISGNSVSGNTSSVQNTNSTTASGNAIFGKNTSFQGQNITSQFQGAQITSQFQDNITKQFGGNGGENHNGQKQGGQFQGAAQPSAASSGANSGSGNFGTSSSNSSNPTANTNPPPIPGRNVNSTASAISNASVMSTASTHPVSVQFRDNITNQFKNTITGQFQGVGGGGSGPGSKSSSNSGGSSGSGRNSPARSTGRNAHGSKQSEGRHSEGRHSEGTHSAGKSGNGEGNADRQVEGDLRRIGVSTNMSGLGIRVDSSSTNKSTVTNTNQIQFGTDTNQSATNQVSTNQFGVTINQFGSNQFSKNQFGSGNFKNQFGSGNNHFSANNPFSASNNASNNQFNQFVRRENVGSTNGSSNQFAKSNIQSVDPQKQSHSSHTATSEPRFAEGGSAGARVGGGEGGQGGQAGLTAGAKGPETNLGGNKASSVSSGNAKPKIVGLSPRVMKHYSSVIDNTNTEGNGNSGGSSSSSFYPSNGGYNRSSKFFPVSVKDIPDDALFKARKNSSSKKKSQTDINSHYDLRPKQQPVGNVSTASSDPIGSNFVSNSNFSSNSKGNSSNSSKTADLDLQCFRELVAATSTGGLTSNNAFQKLSVPSTPLEKPNLKSGENENDTNRVSVTESLGDNNHKLNNANSIHSTDNSVATGFQFQLTKDSGLQITEKPKLKAATIEGNSKDGDNNGDGGDNFTQDFEEHLRKELEEKENNIKAKDSNPANPQTANTAQNPNPNTKQHLYNFTAEKGVAFDKALQMAVIEELSKNSKHDAYLQQQDAKQEQRLNQLSEKVRRFDKEDIALGEWEAEDYVCKELSGGKEGCKREKPVVSNAKKRRMGMSGEGGGGSLSCDLLSFFKKPKEGGGKAGSGSSAGSAASASSGGSSPEASPDRKVKKDTKTASALKRGRIATKSSTGTDGNGNAVGGDDGSGNGLKSYCAVVDMDMFYAAVELRDKPHLRDKPVGVGGMGMLSTSNYVARKYGVRAAMPGFIAKELCRRQGVDLIFIPVDHPKYAAVSKEIQTLICKEFGQYIASMRVPSLDEFFFKLIPMKSPRDAEEVIFKMRKKVLKETGLSCSAGIAENFMLAKIAADVKKPDGQFRVPMVEIEGKSMSSSSSSSLEPEKSSPSSSPSKETPNAEKETNTEKETNNESDSTFGDPLTLDWLSKMPVRKVCGIGKVTQRMLERLQIFTVGDIWEKRGLLWCAMTSGSRGFLLMASRGVGSNYVGEEGPAAFSNLGMRGAEAVLEQQQHEGINYSAKGDGEPTTTKSRPPHSNPNGESPTALANSKNKTLAGVIVQSATGELQKSISQERTFGDCGDLDVLKEKLWDMICIVTEEMKVKKLKGRTVNVKLKLHTFHLRTIARTLGRDDMKAWNRNVSGISGGGKREGARGKRDELNNNLSSSAAGGSSSSGSASGSSASSSSTINVNAAKDGATAVDIANANTNSTESANPTETAEQPIEYYDKNRPNNPAGSGHFTYDANVIYSTAEQILANFFWENPGTMLRLLGVGMSKLADSSEQVGGDGGSASGGAFAPGGKSLLEWLGGGKESGKESGEESGKEPAKESAKESKTHGDASNEKGGASSGGREIQKGDATVSAKGNGVKEEEDVGKEDAGGVVQLDEESEIIDLDSE